MARRRIVDNVADPDILQIADHLKIAADYPVIQVFLPFNHGKLNFRRTVDRLAVADDVDEIYRDILDAWIEAHRNPSAFFKKIGRASCRERVCHYVKMQVVTVSLKK